MIPPVSLTYALSAGAIHFEQEEYERFLQQKAAGTAGNWQSDKVVVRL